MKVVWRKNFIKLYDKLTKPSQEKVKNVLLKFADNPFAPELRNHKLKGKYSGMNSIDAGNDLRIIFRQEGDYAIVLLLRVGSHSHLY